MQDQILAHINGLIVEVVFSLIMTYGGLFVQKVFVTRESQDHLRKALTTGVGYATGSLMNHIIDQGGVSKAFLDAKEEATSKVVEYVKSSVPDAIRRLGASDDHLQMMAESYINQTIADMRLRTRS